PASTPFPYTTLFRSCSQRSRFSTSLPSAVFQPRFRHAQIHSRMPRITYVESVRIATFSGLDCRRVSTAIGPVSSIWLFVVCAKRSEEHTSELQSRFD